MNDTADTDRTIGWAPVLPVHTAAAATAVATETAGRLREPERVRAIAAAAVGQSDHPEWMRWEPHDMAQGDAGLALLMGHLDVCFPRSGWDGAAHAYLSSAARGLERLPHPQPGLFGGVGGVAFVARSLSRHGLRYRRLLAELDRWTAERVTGDGLALAHAPRGVPVGVFDGISGLSGVGVHLLSTCDDPAAAGALRAVLAGLVALCEERDGLPNWHTPFDAMSDQDPMRDAFPHGSLNCGLAHGIPGPLALMALALDAGVAVDGQAAAVRRVAYWLAEHRADDEWGVDWPVAFAIPPDRGTPPGPAPWRARSTWCYGTPGVARALWLAGSALGDDELCGLAVEALLATFRRPETLWGIESPTFCHGLAGLLQITLRFAHDTGHPQLAGAAVELTERLLAQYEPDRALGYPNVEPGGNRVDQPGLLDGAPGVVLTLLAAATDVAPGWDRLFLLS